MLIFNLGVQDLDIFSQDGMSVPVAKSEFLSQMMNAHSGWFDLQGLAATRAPAFIYHLVGEAAS
jgi:hypothetical protein